MSNPLRMKSWSPYVVGAAIGILSWFAFASADKPLGITTAFEHTAALAGKAVLPRVEQTNEYYRAKAGRASHPGSAGSGCSWQGLLGFVAERAAIRRPHEPESANSGDGGSARARASDSPLLSWAVR